MKRKLDDDSNETPKDKKIKLNDVVDNSNNNTWMTVPTEMMIEIFTFIPYRKLIHNLSLVNQYWYDIILGKNTTLWQHLFKHQCFEFNSNFEAQWNFVKKYQPTDIKLMNGARLMTAMELIEPFVTSLTDASLFCFSMHLKKQRLGFPNLQRLYNDISLRELKKYFGTDLSRFKELTFTKCDSLTLDVQFGSLQDIYLSQCGDIETQIVKQNLKTLDKVEIEEINEQTNFECFEALAPTLSTLTISIPKKIVQWKSVAFSKLRDVTIHAYGSHIEQFFSVTHPLLTKVDLYQKDKRRGTGRIFAEQPSIKAVTANMSAQLINALLKVVNKKAVTHMILCTQKNNSKIIELSSFSNLECLSIEDTDSNDSSNIHDVLKNNMISSFTINMTFKLNPVLSYLHNLWELSVNTLDEATFSKLMKLPRLNTLAVNVMRISYGNFTRLISEEVSNIKHYSITSFEIFESYSQIYVVPPLESLHTGSIVLPNKYGVGGAHQWIILVISTLNVDEVDYSVLNDITYQLLSECFTPSWMKRNIFISPVEFLMKHLRIALNDVFEPSSTSMLANLNSQEMTIIKNRFENTLQKEQWKDTKTRHPALNYLITQANNYTIVVDPENDDDYDDDF
jgi:hypothetical protein